MNCIFLLLKKIVRHFFLSREKFSTKRAISTSKSFSAGVDVHVGEHLRMYTNFGRDRQLLRRKNLGEQG